ncbi:MAG: DNA-processing protein DprA [Proteobacteria bacterium]|nr:DNA-processing protein DprA [Pseudomonadota bacterium]MBU4472218.1 DNA-processing protein DprA [Pseudomonadota bacterium]MCG2750427.1 DNA-processing protein DprA [Desulfobacteraceae bacterium]
MNHLIPWFVLKDVSGIGNHLFKRLIDHFKTPDRVLDARGPELSMIPGISERLIRSIHTRSVSNEIKREIETVHKKGYSIVTLNDPDYPALLWQIPDPPPFLYVHGKLTDSVMNIAVVGSRNATAYGIEITQNLCQSLVFHGMTIVSGLARGIDTAAHYGALAGKGKTVAVLGSGLGHIYPPENAGLFHRIAENGAVISEFPLDAEPDAHHFPQRNRIISGMSLGTVVMEATKNSGSLITAKIAAEQNREVFAVPGSIHSHKSTGTHTLIKQGAKLVENAMDILEEFSHLSGGTIHPAHKTGAANLSGPEETVDLSETERSVLKAMGAYPVHIDTLIRQTSLDSGTLSGILLQLELSGFIRQTPGKYFCRAGRLL